MKKIMVLALLLTSVSIFSNVLTYDKVLKNLKGTKYFDKGKFEDAEKYFGDNALKYPKDGKLHYNYGNSLYKSGKLDDAEKEFNLSLRDKNFSDKSKALQNLGNVKFQQKDYKNALNYYRDALLKNPKNDEARYNYELASRFLQQQQKQKKQGKNNKDNKNKKKNKQKQNQQQKKDEQKKQNQKQNQQQQQQQEQQKKQSEKQKQQQLKKEKKKEEAEKMLKALIAKEKKEMKKKKEKMATEKAKTGKYW